VKNPAKTRMKKSPDPIPILTATTVELHLVKRKNLNPLPKKNLPVKTRKESPKEPKE